MYEGRICLAGPMVHERRLFIFSCILLGHNVFNFYAALDFQFPFCKLCDMLFLGELDLMTQVLLHINEVDLEIPE
jgi:hypothetical protein